MNSIRKFLLAGALAFTLLAGAAATSNAQSFSFSIEGGDPYYRPSPYYYPAPRYYYTPRYYYRPAPRYYGEYRGRDRGHHRHHRHH